jgi:hypothetical protein
MKTRCLCPAVCMAAMILSSQSSGQEVSDNPRLERVAVFYFGNSLTGSTAPELHTALGKSASREWVWDSLPVAGGQLWQYRDQFQLDGKIEKPADFAANPGLAAKAPYHAQRFLTGDWDAVVLQPFGMGLRLERDEMWGRTYDAPRDFGDIAAAKYLIDLALVKNPACRVLIYQDWPGLTIAGEAFGHAGAGLAKTGKELSHRQMEPVRRSCDFPREWLRRYDPEAVTWLAGGQSRDYDQRLMGELIQAYPKLWAEGRLRMIPVGDIYYALDRKMRAGQVPGVVNLGEFYTDTLHHRAGMPAYTCAATFFTLLFGEKPHGLDHTLYNHQDAYGKDWGHGKDQHNDSGTVLEITPERAKAVNDTIWEVVNAHPYTRFSKEGSKEALAKFEAAIPAPEPVRVLEYGRLAGWSAMPFWQAGLDRTAGKHSAWLAVLDLNPWSQTWACQWLAGVFRENKHPYGFREYFMEMDEPYHDADLRHQMLCLQVGSPTDEEVEGFVYLARRFRQRRGEAFFLGYFAWLAIPEAAAIKNEEKLEPWQLIPEEKMQALRGGFEYTAAWNDPQAIEGTAAGMKAFCEKLKQADPEIARRFRVIPAGALLAALDVRLKAGALPGMAGVGEFYKDDATLRTGLPRYALAALRHAVVHRSHPKNLDAHCFDDPKAYPPDALDPARKRGAGRANVVVGDDDFDNGPHLPITPDGKKLVDDTIWELVGRQLTP